MAAAVVVVVVDDDDESSEVLRNAVAPLAVRSIAPNGLAAAPLSLNEDCDIDE